MKDIYFSTAQSITPIAPILLALDLVPQLEALEALEAWLMGSQRLSMWCQGRVDLQGFTTQSLNRRSLMPLTQREIYFFYLFIYLSYISIDAFLHFPRKNVWLLLALTRTCLSKVWRTWFGPKAICSSLSYPKHG